MDFKASLIDYLNNQLKAQIILEIPPNRDFGDFALPCFKLKRSPLDIQNSLKKLPAFIEKTEIKGGYLNFFIKKDIFISTVVNYILKEGNSYGSSKLGKKKVIVIDMSSPNIAKPFGIGHLRSTIIGNSISNICFKLGFKIIKLNYLGDCGTPFGKIIIAFKDFGSESELKKDPINHLYNLYVKASSIDKYEDLGRLWFNKLESGDKEAIILWKRFRSLCIKEFDKIYSILNIKFDIISGESLYNKKMGKTIKELESKNLISDSENARVVNLEEFNLGVALIQKSDGSTLYVTRDITAAMDRVKKLKAYRLFYEVGSEQSLHFKQLFKILELMGYNWAKDCVHINHGLYLDSDGKKFATRKGKTVFMIDIINETIGLAKDVINEKNPNLKNKDIVAKNVAIGAIIYGDLKNVRSKDIIFDIDKFINFEGDTGPYIQYTYARASSILRKSKIPIKKIKAVSITKEEVGLVSLLSRFPDIIKSSYDSLSPHIIAGYILDLAHSFNEFYHTCPVISDNKELMKYRTGLVCAVKITLGSCLDILGMPRTEEM